MTPTFPLRRARSGLVRLSLLTLLAAGLHAGDAHADTNPSNYDCQGHIEAGTPAPGEEDTTVRYRFGCNGPITGYQIQTNLSDTGFDTDTVVFDRFNVPVTTDAFSCAGDFPGFGFNCTGTYSGAYNNVLGQFTIAERLCAEPRLDPLLTVTYATADANRKVTQYISGPFDLGRPHGCPPSRTGKLRIPRDDTSTTRRAATRQTTARKLAARRAAARRARTRTAATGGSA
ncbi:MAG: hypothetical protein JWM31_1759 [Solirubrobacterales bacterium]|nr:hypothetical protein [Solirubrobacterales bacterium]